MKQACLLLPGKGDNKMIFLKHVCDEVNLFSI